MKKSRIVTFILAIVCLSLMTVTTFAAEERRASDQISQYSMEVLPVSGALNVEIYIQGNGSMDKLGCESLKVYEKRGSTWWIIENLDEDDEGMSSTDSLRHRNTISVDTEAGMEYKVVVTLFAEDDVARDTRSKTFYVTGR